MKGLGDVVEAITTATGIKAVVKFLVGEDCNCDARQEKLNKLFPFKTVKPLCMTEDEYNYFTTFIAGFNGQVVKSQHIEPLSKMHARIFQYKYKKPICSCNPQQWLNAISDLKAVYSTYEQ